MPERRAEFRLTPEAKRDLEGIWLHSLEQWGLQQANRYLDDLTTVLAKLASNPNLATSCDHIRKGYRRRRTGRHVVYLRITDYGIAVIRVLHDRMEPSRHL